MLQVVDEIDDAIAVIRHRWLGLDAHIGALAAGIAACAVAAAVMLKTSLSILRALP